MGNRSVENRSVENRSVENRSVKNRNKCMESSRFQVQDDFTVIIST